MNVKLVPWHFLVTRKDGSEVVRYQPASVEGVSIEDAEEIQLHIDAFIGDHKRHVITVINGDLPK